MAAGMTCIESEELLALAALGVLPAADGVTLDAHVRGCAHCQAKAAEFLSTTALLPESLDLAKPPASLRRKLMAEVYAGSPHKQRVSWFRRVWDAIPQGRSLTLVGAAAAIAAVVLGVWGAGRGAPPASQTQPEVFTVVATTTDQAAHGTLTYYQASHESIVMVAGLPDQTAVGTRPPDVYELWLINAQGATAAAYLTLSPLTHTWDAAINGDMSRFTSMAATSEPAGGSSQPTGPQLFSVSLQ